MNTRYRIALRKSAGNLHLSLFGEFNGMCAWELFKTIKRGQPASGRIFVGTAGLGAITRTGVQLFKTRMSADNIEKERLYFKGEKGFEIAPEGSRVLLFKKEADRRSPERKRNANPICRRLRANADLFDIPNHKTQLTGKEELWPKH